MAEYDHVVIGAGIIGSWTAWHLAKLGKKVLLLEQFNDLKSRGSSQGESRLIRSVYIQDYFAEMMPYAFDYWHQAEKDSGKKLIENSGVLLVYKRPMKDDKYDRVLSCMRKYNAKHLAPEEIDTVLRSESLHFNKEAHAFIFDKSGGVLLAQKAVSTMQELFRKEGGHIWYNCQVQSIVPNLKGNEVEINTTRGQLVATSVIVCAGPWTKKLLVPSLIPDLPLQTLMAKLYYWREKKDGAHKIDSKFPAVVDSDRPNVYVLPSTSNEYPGLVKVCAHEGTPCDPDKRDQPVTNMQTEKYLRDYVAEHFPLLEKEPEISETCMYTLTPDESYLIDRVPGHRNIIIGAGFSGTGFKTAPVVGRLLTEMAVGKETFLDISHYSLSRFA